MSEGRKFSMFSLPSMILHTSIMSPIIPLLSNIKRTNCSCSSDSFIHSYSSANGSGWQTNWIWVKNKFPSWIQKWKCMASVEDVTIKGHEHNQEMGAFTDILWYSLLELWSRSRVYLFSPNSTIWRKSYYFWWNIPYMVKGKGLTTLYQDIACRPYLNTNPF